jgi:hypothetical protein
VGAGADDGDGDVTFSFDDLDGDGSNDIMKSVAARVKAARELAKRLASKEEELDEEAAVDASRAAPAPVVSALPPAARPPSPADPPWPPQVTPHADSPSPPDTVLESGAMESVTGEIEVDNTDYIAENGGDVDAAAAAASAAAAAAAAEAEEAELLANAFAARAVSDMAGTGIYVQTVTRRATLSSCGVFCMTLRAVLGSRQPVDPPATAN